MDAESLQAKLAVKFPKVEKDKTQVKKYLTLRVPESSGLLPVLKYLKEEGFDYLDMVAAVDWSGPVGMEGFVREPNPHVFLSEGPKPVTPVPKKAADAPYRDAFEVVYCMTNISEKLKVFLKLDVPRKGGTAPSAIGLFKGADWQEREIFDLYGVRFEGHPNLKKLLTPDFLEGHPLRKDYVHKKDRFD